jgi:hypothetical protein
LSSYTLDFPTIMAVFHDQRRTGELRAESVRLKGKGVFRARITFYNGKDLSCVLAYPTGQFYADGENARQLLARAGVLEWNWIAKPTTNPAVRVPVRTTRPLELDIIFRRNQGSLNGLSLLPDRISTCCFSWMGNGRLSRSPRSSLGRACRRSTAYSLSCINRAGSFFSRYEQTIRKYSDRT